MPNLKMYNTELGYISRVSQAVRGMCFVIYGWKIDIFGILPSTQIIILMEK